MNKLAGELEKYRIAHKMKKTEMARLLGITVNHYYTILGDEPNLNGELFIRIINLLDVPIATLFDENSESPWDEQYKFSNEIDNISKENMVRLINVILALVNS